MKVKFKPGPKASGFAGFDGLKRTCVKYSIRSISGKGQANNALRCVKYKKGRGYPPCKAGPRGVDGRSPGLLRKSTRGCARGKG